MKVCCGPGLSSRVPSATHLDSLLRSRRILSGPGVVRHTSVGVGTPERHLFDLTGSSLDSRDVFCKPPFFSLALFGCRSPSFLSYSSVPVTSPCVPVSGQDFGCLERAPTTLLTGSSSYTPYHVLRGDVWGVRDAPSAHVRGDTSYELLNAL